MISALTHALSREPLLWISILTWLIGPILAFFVYRDARKNDMGPVTWAVVVFFTVFNGALVYLAVKNTVQIREKLHSGVEGETREQQRPEIPLAPLSPPDPDFRDAHLDRLIADGRLGEAHKDLRERIRAALDADDLAAIRDYSQYEERINKARMGEF